MQYVCRIPKLIGMEQALTQLEVKMLFDDSTHYYDDDATEADTTMDAVYEVDADDNLFCIFTFYMNIYKWQTISSICVPLCFGILHIKK